MQLSLSVNRREMHLVCVEDENGNPKNPVSYLRG